MAGKFEPKTPVNLQPPKDNPITLEELAAANGEFPSFPTTPGQLSTTNWAMLFISLISLSPANSTGVDGGKCYVAIKVSKAR
jgi:hypothetical protein